MIEPITELTRLEETSVFTLLGIRFWDLAQSRQVSDGLDVRAWPKAAPRFKSTAVRAASGIFAFHDLPRLYHLEHPSPGKDPWMAATTPFVVEARDLRRRYLPLVFGVNVPFKGVFPTNAMVSPLFDNPAGCYLFAAPTRRVLAGEAALRATLWDISNEQPAACAVVEAQVEGKTWHGIADERGNVVVPFPCPEFMVPETLSPPQEPVQQKWQVRVRVKYEPGRLLRLEGSDTPTIRSIFDQERAVLWRVDVGPDHSELNFQLVYGEELVMRTGGQSTLWLNTATSPP